MKPDLKSIRGFSKWFKSLDQDKREAFVAAFNGEYSPPVKVNGKARFVWIIEGPDGQLGRTAFPTHKSAFAAIRWFGHGYRLCGFIQWKSSHLPKQAKLS